MERLLLAIDLDVTDDEEFNAIFRCAHSVKGGAATFGFSDIAELTHEMETLLDRLRRRELSASPRMVDVLLESGDALRALLEGHRSGQGAHAVDTKDLVREIRDMAEGRAASLAPRPDTSRAAAAASVSVATNEAAPVALAAAAAPTAAEDEGLPPGMRLLELTVGPLDRPEQADDLRALFAEIPDLGRIEPLDGGIEADNHRRFKLTTSSSDEDLIDLFCFHVDRSAVRLTPLGLGYGFHDGAPGDPTVEPHGEGARPAAAGLPEIDGFGLFDDVPDTASAAEQPLEEPALPLAGGGSASADQVSALHSTPVPATSAPQHAPPAGQGREPETGADGASGSNRARARSSRAPFGFPSGIPS
jgi:two-component system chemotaxis sensor kinase CheA